MIDHAPKSSSIHPRRPLCDETATASGRNPRGVGRRPLLAFSLPTEPASPAQLQPFTTQLTAQGIVTSPHGAAAAGCLLLPKMHTVTALGPPLPTPEGSFCYQRPGSRPSHPPSAHSQSWPHVPTFPAILTGLALWTGWPWQSSPDRDCCQIPGLRGRDEGGGSTTYCIYCSVYMRDDDDAEENTKPNREKETPASFGTTLSPPPFPIPPPPAHA